MTAYQNQLTEKTNRLKQLLSPFSAPAPVIYPSPATGYRMRAAFSIWHEQEDLYYAMSDRQGKIIMHTNQFPPACAAINALMPRLIAAIKPHELLRKHLFEVRFHAGLSGDMMVTLLYHKVLTLSWEQAARALSQQLGNVSLIGRARKQKQVIGYDYVQEYFTVGQRQYSYRQYEGSFSQPNAVICQEMLAWAVQQSANNDGDLLELYCGNGNFTLPLAQNFHRVLATEVSKRGIQALRENITANQVHNIAVARLSAEEYAQAAAGERVFKRLIQANIQLTDYHFSTVFVDPPRAGIAPNTLHLLQQFPHIIYISCNPETLAENLKVLQQSHQMTATALFDQFPHTPHIECGVILRRR